MGRRELTKGDVQWYAKGKKPITYSSIATSQLLAILSEQTENHTPSEILPLITYDNEAKRIMKIYIDKGFGNTSLNIKYHRKHRKKIKGDD